MDIFAAAGLDKPDISVLSDEFLAEVQGMPHRNLAVELSAEVVEGRVECPRDAGRTWCRRDPSPRCWSRRSAATRTGR